MINTSRAVFLCLFSMLLAAELEAADATKSFGANVQYRGNLDHARLQFETTKKGRVAFIGGSITEMDGYRPMVCENLKKRFPQTEFTFVSAGIASTCSTTGAFRLATDVLAGAPIDLFFIEFAVNDDQDAHHTRDECVRGMEGIVRHALLTNPNMDIVITYFVNEGMIKTIQAGQTPLPIEAHEAVAAHYSVSTINLAKEVTEEIDAKTLTWKQYGGVHPAKFGNAICAAMIEDLFNRAWSAPLSQDAKTTAKALPQPLDPLNYSAGRFIDPKLAVFKSGWTLGVPDWKSLKGGKRERFTTIPMLSSTEPGVELTLDFEGTAVGAYIVAGPDAGAAIASIDGGDAVEVTLLHAFSSGLHYPRTVMFGTNLKPGKHTLSLRLAATKGGGSAMRVMQFTAN